MAEMESWVKEMLRLQDEDDKMTEKQIKILEAAVEIFSKKGYAATSTNEIAQKAGVAEGTIFRHYKSKKDLLISIVAPIMSKLIAPFVMREFYKVLDAEYGRFEDFLRAVILNRAEFARKHLPVLKILLQEIPFQPELREQFVDKVGTHVFERFSKAVELFQNKGQLVRIPPFRTMRLVASSAVGFMLLRYLLLPQHEWDDEEEIEATIDFIMHGLSPRPE